MAEGNISSVRLLHRVIPIPDYNGTGDWLNLSFSANKGDALYCSVGTNYETGQFNVTTKGSVTGTYGAGTYQNADYKNIKSIYLYVVNTDEIITLTGFSNNLANFKGCSVLIYRPYII